MRSSSEFFCPSIQPLCSPCSFAFSYSPTSPPSTLPLSTYLLHSFLCGCEAFLYAIRHIRASVPFDFVTEFSYTNTVGCKHDTHLSPPPLFYRTEFSSQTDAITAWEDFLRASKGTLSVSEIAKIRDAVGVMGMAGT